MLERVSPESVGVSSRAVLKFIKTLEKYNLNTHSLLMTRGDKVFSECYYAPFHQEFKHRMYSVSKSFVAVAIGLLVEEGKLSLDDKFISFFPDYVKDVSDPLLEEMTIRDALKMQTALTPHPNWFITGTNDRVEMYFRRPGSIIPGTRFAYDSPGSFMLCAIVEDITGKPFLEYLKERFLLKTGFSADAYCIKCPGGHSFGDSGVMCTARDLWRFARFVMNYGTWDGVRYMDEAYLREATSCLTANNYRGDRRYNSYGYGYQIWKAPRDGFAFVGMGDQFAICDPKTDFILIINSDNQGSPNSRDILYYALYDLIVESLGEPLPEDSEAFEALKAFEASRRLNAADDCVFSPFAKEVNDVTYRLQENPMGISWIRLDLDDKGGVLHYENARGEKALPFGFGYNVFGKFPEEGYADLIATVPQAGHKYDCAVSADWLEEKKLHLQIQIIDKYFGICHMCFNFKDKRVTVEMQKTAEAFLDGYHGTAIGEAE